MEETHVNKCVTSAITDYSQLFSVNVNYFPFDYQMKLDRYFFSCLIYYYYFCEKTYTEFYFLEVHLWIEYLAGDSIIIQTALYQLSLTSFQCLTSAMSGVDIKHGSDVTYVNTNTISEIENNFKIKMTFKSFFFLLSFFSCRMAIWILNIWFL